MTCLLVIYFLLSFLLTTVVLQVSMHVFLIIQWDIVAVKKERNESWGGSYKSGSLVSVVCM